MGWGLPTFSVIFQQYKTWMQMKIRMWMRMQMRKRQCGLMLIFNLLMFSLLPLYSIPIYWNDVLPVRTDYGHSTCSRMHSSLLTHWEKTRLKWVTSSMVEDRKITLSNRVTFLDYHVNCLTIEKNLVSINHIKEATKIHMK